MLESGVNSTKDSAVGREKGRVSPQPKRVTRMTLKASKLISCVCKTRFKSSALLGQLSESANKKLVLESDLVSTEDLSSATRGKGSQPKRVTRMTVKPSKLISCLW